MDRTFLTQMSESFYNDYSLKDHGLWESREHAVGDINQYMVNLMKQVSFEDPTLYREMHEMGRSQQYAITYFLIEDFINEEYPDNEVFVIEGNEDDLFLTELGIGATIALGTGAAAVVGYTVGKIMNHIVTNYRGPVNKKITQSVVKLYDWTTKHFKEFKKATASRRAVDAVIYSNLDKCGKRCGVSDAPGASNMASRIEYPARDVDAPIDKKSAQQFECLFKCYITYNIEVGNALFNQYQQCTKNQVNRDMTLYMNQPEGTAAQCSQYYTAMVDHFGMYKEVIESLPFIKAGDQQLFLTAYFKGPSAVRSVGI